MGWVSGRLRTFSQLFLLHKWRLITVKRETVCVGLWSSSTLFLPIYHNFSCDPEGSEKGQVCYTVIKQPLWECSWVQSLWVNKFWWTDSYWVMSHQCLHLEITRCGEGMSTSSIWYKIQSACWQWNGEVYGLPGALSTGRNHNTHFLLFMLSIFSDFLLWKQSPSAEIPFDFVGCARGVGTCHWITVDFIGKSQGTEKVTLH